MGGKPSARVSSPDELTAVELINRYWDSVDEYSRHPDGTPALRPPGRHQFGILRTADNFTDRRIFHALHTVIPVVSDPARVSRHEVQDVAAPRVLRLVAVGAVERETVMKVAVARRDLTGNGRHFCAGRDTRRLERPLRVVDVDVVA